MNKILILVGCPASGKSTYAKQLCIDDSTYKRINKDDIRIELFENNYKYSKENENLVLETERQRGISFIDSGFNIIVDDTNCHMKHIEYWSNIAKYKGLKLEIKQFDTTLEECIERDKNRETKVGEEVVRNIHNQYLKIKKQLKSYIFDDRVSYILNRDNKERCIILDSDDCVLILLPKTITREVTVFSQLSYSDHVVKFVDDCKFEINYTKEYDKIIKVISLYTSSEHGKLKISVTDKDAYSYESYLKNLTIVTNTFKDEECMKSFKFSSYVFMYYLYCKEMNNNRGIKLK